MIDAGRTLAAARRLELVMAGGLGLLAALALAGLVVSAIAPVSVAQGLARQAGFGGAVLEAWQAWTLIGVGVVHAGVWLALLAVARAMFRMIVAGDPKAAAGKARTLALLLWAMLIWGVFSQMIASVAATWGFPEGERTLSIAFGTPQISVAFAALIASFLAHAFALGAELWQDHREVI